MSRIRIEKFIDDDTSSFIFSDNEDSEQKQNAVLPGFTTPSNLDKEVEEILQSIKPDVMASIKKTKYFEKGSKSESNKS